MDCQPMSHVWSAEEWDWPLQFNEETAHVINTEEQFKVFLDVRYFTPNEIQVKAFGQELLWIHCKQKEKDDSCRSIAREFHRAYRLPDDVDTSTLKFLLRKNGIMLIIEAQKRNRIVEY